MARALWLADALRAEGVKVIEVAGWQSRGSSSFTPRGIIAHHTASSPRGGNVPSLNICINGRSDLPGPLANVVLARNGTAYVIASGRANHAGAGTWRGLSGNSQFLGIEAENNGVGEKWSDEQMEAYVRVCAAMCRRLKLSSSYVAAHYEYARPRGRKIDPFGHSDFMTRFRSRIAARLNKSAAPAPEPQKPELTPEQKEEQELMSAKDDIIRELTGEIQRSKPMAIRCKEDSKVYVVTGAGKWYVNGRSLLNVLYFTGMIRADKDNQPGVLSKAELDLIPNID